MNTHVAAVHSGDIASPLSKQRRAELLAGSFLAGYSNDRTRKAYRQILREWFAFLVDLDPTIDPIYDVRRGHIDAYARWAEGRSLNARTVYRRISTLSAWHQYLVGEEYLTRDPTMRVKRPTLPRESTRTWLGRHELADFLDAGEAAGGYPYALACLLGINALRINEALSADVTDLSRERHHHVLRIIGKGNQPDLVVLPARTVEAVFSALGGRDVGPLLLNRSGTRMQRDAAGRIVNNLARDARIAKHVTPHSLRHSAVTAYLNATDGDITGAQQFARHSDLRTTQYYDRRRQRLDRAGGYVVANYAAGGD